MREYLRLHPEARDVELTLARAYQWAGRYDDATRIREQEEEIQEQLNELRAGQTGGDDSPVLKLFASYASGGQHSHGKEIELGQGLVGQCAIDKTKIHLTNVPSTAFRVASGLS